MDQNEIAVFQQAIETCENPAEIARKVKLVFKRMPGELALACFAKVMTAELPRIRSRRRSVTPQQPRPLLERRRPACGQAGGVISC